MNKQPDEIEERKRLQKLYNITESELINYGRCGQGIPLSGMVAAAFSEVGNRERKKEQSGSALRKALRNSMMSLTKEQRLQFLEENPAIRKLFAPNEFCAFHDYADIPARLQNVFLTIFKWQTSSNTLYKAIEEAKK